jgi:hypothetical protein
LEDIMKRKIGVAALIGLVAAGALAAAASAQCISPTLIKFDNDTFAYETNYNNATYMSAVGSQLTVVGIITCFGPPLDFLNANMPAKQYTVWLTGLTSMGTVAVVGPPNTWNTSYSTGSAQFFIFEDSSTPAPTAATLPPNPPNATVPSTFTDGTIILSGTIDYFHTLITQGSTGHWSGSFNALYTATGGTQYPKVGGAQANLNGLWCSLGTGVSQCSLPAGYSAHPSGKFDQPSSTPARPSTWGRMKMLYR